MRARPVSETGSANPEGQCRARPVRGLAAAFAGCVVLCGCRQLDVLRPAGPVGAAEKTILLNSLAIMLVIVVPTIVAVLAFACWFRAGNGKARRLPDFVYSGRIEAITWSIPILVIMFLGGVSWIGSHDLDPYKSLPSAARPVEIQAVSLDWKWLFIYPELGIAAVNQLTVPVGVPLHFSLTSASVMNTFFVPRLGSMIYTMNGMSDQLNLQADQPGVYYGQSAMFSGDGFSDMHFAVEAVMPDRFDAWVQSVRGTGPTLDQEAYSGLEQQSVAASPSTYGAVEPGLYDRIVRQQIPPAPGSQNGSPSSAVSPRTEADNVR
ncbi:MAG: ubiquinol oxidase subunit II [Alphaproteobacteria bacterium]|nr:ubiquinol oxidase subunit II [Alphaproteobacteria bacterium]